MVRVRRCGPISSEREVLTPVQLPSHLRISERTVLVRAFACCLGIMATAAWMSAGEPEKRKFDVPADLAEKSLRVFSVHSGSEVLFSSDAANGVRTNAIMGELSPGEAVKKMLAGTTLYVRDERDGCYLLTNRQTATRAESGEPICSFSAIHRYGAPACFLTMNALSTFHRGDLRV